MESLKILFPRTILTHSIEIPGHQSVGLVVVGSLRQSEAENQRDLGDFTAGHLIATIKDAEKQGKYVAFDMPTGATPKPTWIALKEAVEKGGVDLSRVIWLGHEADFPPQPGSSLDYEKQRIDILKLLGVAPQPICSSSDMTLPVISGNFVPMHLYKSTGQDLQSTVAAAYQSMALYDEILDDLLGRENVLSVGDQGVGSDGHFVEMQLFHMWPEVWKDTAESFTIPIEHYRRQHGLWRLSDGEGGFEKGNNALGERTENYPGLYLLAGLGRNVLTRLGDCLIIFNSSAKFAALRNTLQALGGNIRMESGQLTENHPLPAEGESLLPQFIAYAKQLQEQGLLQPQNYQEAKSCYEVMQMISQSWTGKVAESTHYPLWRLIGRYFGSETPVSRVIQERAANNKRTTIVLPADVVRGTELEKLAV